MKKCTFIKLQNVKNEYGFSTELTAKGPSRDSRFSVSPNRQRESVNSLKKVCLREKLRKRVILSKT